MKRHRFLSDTILTSSGLSLSAALPVAFSKERHIAKKSSEKMIKASVLFFTICLSAFHLTNAQPISLSTAQNQVIEWAYQSDKIYKEPFRDVSLHAIIKDPDGKQIRLSAFWAGENEWRFRFAASQKGDYTFITECNDRKNVELHGKKGKISVVDYKGDNPLYRHGPVKISENKRYLVHEDGAPFLWLADSWWHGMTTRFKWPEDFKYLTADRKEKGFSVIQFAIGFPCDIEPFDPRGQNEAGDPWDEELNSINPAYFDLVDLRVQWLLEEGIMPNIVGAWGYYIKWLGVEKMQQHWDYILARYGAYPVTWTLCGESTLAYYTDLRDGNWDTYKAEFREQWSEVAKHLKASDPFQRLLTVHPGPGARDGLPPIDQMEHVDFVMVQPGHSGYQTLPYASKTFWETYAKYADRPVLYGEVCFEGMWGRSLQDVQRYLFWSSMLSGAPGFSYGVEGIWQFNTEEELFGATPIGDVWGNVPWETAHQYLGSKHIGLGKKLLEKMDWQSLRPFPEGLNRHAKEDDVFLPFCAASPEGLRVLYFFNGIRGLTMKRLNENTKYSYAFFDPIHGEVHESGSFVASEQGTWEVPREPVKQDWVLVVQPE
ncbi:DUF5060 domain-containing protein [Pararhodonellum marinum]|uniref:DUF5060 domain-containing protein n=1 Tax=Pararhodonellum marinum TaxID=2755358 RepID=UPI00188E86F3|nr:DUF5060 domain-containing protein [Pararhodonellum marinum]